MASPRYKLMLLLSSSSLSPTIPLLSLLNRKNYLSRSPGHEAVLTCYANYIRSKPFSIYIHYFSHPEPYCFVCRTRCTIINNNNPNQHRHPVPPEPHLRMYQDAGLDAQRPTMRRRRGTMPRSYREDKGQDG
ncbi:hypothetical protein F5Y17DRAFT_86398 [Xylariaceae sp. FL0594]|nr:hypothetical protein F5Y17DRAFT_86398 [Xylariaceae sp. FL0594]